jgi:hypothetical protein
MVDAARLRAMLEHLADAEAMLGDCETVAPTRSAVMSTS